MTSTEPVVGPTPARCDICGEPVRYGSLDLIACTTVYDDNGEPIKTMEPPPEAIAEHNDYLVTCGDCQDFVVFTWNQMVHGLKNFMNIQPEDDPRRPHRVN